MTANTATTANTAITKFQGETRWLPNFQAVDVQLDDVTYLTTEHAYQAAKTLDPAMRESIRTAATPGIAKRLGQAVALRGDWEDVKRDVMLDLLRQKYRQEPLLSKLIATGDALLVEGNAWGDRFWGVCGGVGENWLGRLTMQVRDEIIETRSTATPPCSAPPR